MNCVSSYRIKIKHYNKIFRDTVNIYKHAVTFFINVILNEWSDLSKHKSGNFAIRDTELLTHYTKSNPAPKYDFDKSFYKMPTYLRRSAISDAFGIVSSYKSLYQNWLDDGKVGGEPKLQQKHNKLPTFYYKNMFVGDCFSDEGKIKIYHNNDWIWLNVKFRNQDIKYFNRHCRNKKISAPILEYHYGTYYLRFAVSEKTKLNNTKIKDQKILSVDLGLNTFATCSVMDYKGTVYGRKFVNFPYEKDLLNHKLNRLKKFQRQHGSKNSKGQWSFINNLNRDISIKVSNEIISFATEHKVDVIVFEHLDIKSKKYGNNAQRLQLWRKKDIQHRVEANAHKLDIRVATVNPSNTSKLAYDGSGVVKRNTKNYSICTFSTGKTYNCDLNASYNIGARYFIRELLKPLSVTKRSQLEAKVPVIVRRTQCTLSTLISLSKVLNTISA